jgi:hypothetical protein
VSALTPGGASVDIVEHFKDTYAIRVTLESHWVSFVVKEKVGETLSPPPAGLWLYRRESGSSRSSVDDGDDTADFDLGEVFLDGTIKWDGCSNWDFHTSDVLIHFCGRRQATGLGRLLDHLYQIAQERLVTYDQSLAE